MIREHYERMEHAFRIILVLIRISNDTRSAHSRSYRMQKVTMLAIRTEERTLACLVPPLTDSLEPRAASLLRRAYRSSNYARKRESEKYLAGRRAAAEPKIEECTRRGCGRGRSIVGWTADDEGANEG